MPVYLGIDYGTRRIGLAWADELEVAFPLGAIAGVESKGWLEQLSKVVEERGVTEFVVGYPLHMDGEVGLRAKEVDSFADRLREKFGLPVSKVDERLTRLAAEEALGKKGEPEGLKINLNDSYIKFTEELDGRGEGINAFKISVKNKQKTLEKAKSLNLLEDGDIFIGGVNFLLE